MQDITSAVAKGLGQLIDSGRIETMIATQIEKTIGEIIQREMKEYSDFGKIVQEAVKAALTFDPQRISLPSYNAMVCDLIRQHVENAMRKDAADHVKKLMDELLGTPPKQIKLSDLVEQFKEHVKDCWRYDGEHAVTCIVEKTEYSSQWVYLGYKPDMDKYKCEFRMLVSHPYRGEGPLTVSTVWLGTSEVTSGVFLADRSGFERCLFQLWTCKVPIILDDDAVSREFEGLD